LPRVLKVVIKLFVAKRPGPLVPKGDSEPGVHSISLFRDPGLDPENLVPHVDPIDHGAFVWVFRDKVLVEEAQRMLGRSGGQPDDMRVKVLKHLPPESVNGPMAFVRDDEIEGLDRDIWVVRQGRYFPFAGGPGFKGGSFLRFFFQLPPLEHRIQPLDGRDDHLGILVHAIGVQMLNDVGVGKAVCRSGRMIALVFPQGLVAQVVPIHKEKNASGSRVLDQPVAEGAGGERLARPCRHLDQERGSSLASELSNPSIASI
jgi:hypothetical protein